MKSRRLYYISRITNLLIETNNPKMKVDEIATRLGITKKLSTTTSIASSSYSNAC